MAEPKKKTRTRSAGAAARTKTPAGSTRGRRKPAPPKEPPAPVIERETRQETAVLERPIPAPAAFDDTDFSAGILEPSELPPIRHAAPATPTSFGRPSRAFEKPAEQDRPVEKSTVTRAGEDDGTFIDEAPAEIEDTDLEPESPLAESDEADIEEAHEDAVESTEPRRPIDDEKGDGRRRRRGRRGRGGRGRRDDGMVAEAPRTGAPREIEESDDEEALPRGATYGDEGSAPSVIGQPRGAREDARRPARGRPARMPEPEEEVADDREMLINVSDADECRIALLREGRLDELYIERASSASNVGNIYKGRVTNVEPSIQAAFIDFGLPIHGFLHISDLHPKYFPESKGENELVGRKTPRRQRPPIQTCLKRGQELIVQVIKEGIGTKGPTLSTYVSIPGRFLVMMPGMEELGVSRKIEDEDQRRKLRDLLNQLELPRDMGFIVRTAGIDRHVRDLQRDLNYLTRLWSKVAARIKSEPAPAELYRESDLVIRTIRDVYDSSIRRILVDNETVAERVREFLAIASPKAVDAVEFYDGADPLFHRFGIESEIDKLHSKNVPLACGGSLVIEQTEALVAIDVNSGRFRVSDNPEETAYRVNQEAADEIARQLRLRDLGGLIICDFIDMMAEKHRRSIENRLADALKKHKERAKLLRISRFGILEMTRQRQRPSFAKSMFADCPRCGGSGRVKAPESVALDAMRQISIASHKEGVASIDVRVAAPVAGELLNRKRHQITDLERAGGQTIRIHGEPNFGIDQITLVATDRRGREIAGGAAPASSQRPPRSFNTNRNAPAPVDRRPFGPQDPGDGEPRTTGPRPDGGRRRRGGRRRGGRGRGAPRD